ncbi:hypothetical protein C7999DRAFT_31838 [Corynascus novoguineensis]|uniref:Transcription factor Iwr1 domain-containing protein n=1 Tax=Corynascus novoguineensis TaxID=1126955 RepID=A0AAN7CTK2_9PEZI|nr:hypothetical protein C7999DRAFT_31838 [Corynascus novoguineensis]
MAGLPPHTIHVKRKRGNDEDAVEFLRLEESKRSRSSEEGGWVYQLKQAVETRSGHAVEPSSPGVPVIQPTRKGDEDRRSKRPRKQSQAPENDNATTSGTAPAASAGPEQPAPTASHPAPDRVRRFHMSRSHSPQPAAGVSKKRAMPAVFVERGAKKQRETLKALIQERNVTPTGPPKPTDDSQPPESPSPLNGEAAAALQSSPVKYKRPGTRACSHASKNKTLPPSMRDREDTDMDELARVMDSWTVDEITKNLDRMQAQSTTSKYSPATSRFKPKAPKLRYFERHPESLASKQRGSLEPQAPPGTAVMDVDTTTGDTTDEEDYVLETYERVPAERLRDQAVPSHRVGLLVFDTEPDMVQFFYGTEGDSDDDLPEDEEDENAENYYTADYPEEELDWDDEFGRNPYTYTTQNDSDREEYDVRDFDDENWDDDDQVGSFSGKSDEWRP